MRQFKVGDKVKCVTPHRSGEWDLESNVYTIMEDPYGGSTINQDIFFLLEVGKLKSFMADRFQLVSKHRPDWW